MKLIGKIVLVGWLAATAGIGAKIGTCYDHYADEQIRYEQYRADYKAGNEIKGESRKGACCGALLGLVVGSVIAAAVSSKPNPYRFADNDPIYASTPDRSSTEGRDVNKDDNNRTSSGTGYPG